MPDVVIRTENLGKRYRLGERELYRTLRESISRSVATTIRRRDRQARTRDEVWALSDLSVDVQQGDVLGLVGANGAGKSTLLKILSRVTRPTTGTAHLRGRVASLLEVGTGFHMELTGRDNIYLNGVVLGMTRRETTRKFDEIVEFAGVERFLDTPVKRYSSGMVVRLGFAVAAHLEPEILIVDEVLAVGDAEFQRKCLGKLDDVAREGRTILFVSHNMNAVQRLCSRAIALKHGRLAREGGVEDVIAWYVREASLTDASDGWLDVRQVHREGGDGAARVVAVSCTSDNEAVGLQPYSEGPLTVKLLVETDEDRTLGSVAVMLYDELGTKLVNADSVKLGKPISLRRGRTTLTIEISALHLVAGTYVLGWWLAAAAGAGVCDFAERAAHVEVLERPGTGIASRPLSDGAVTCDFDVSVEPEE